ncbi:DNA polymerase III subunit chi [bacterium BMS3Abin11]|nr:DNA polymerase III subunit chi [bacterium BMS3Abin11]GMT39637.1 MAG: DNA polymerase III subunit chi [bacterium]
MSQIDFHILDNKDNSSLLVYACRVARKAYNNGYRVYIRVENEQDMQQLDTLLWTFSELDFIPHASIATECGQEPVIIGMIEYTGDSNMVLINISTKMASNYSRYSRVIELISNDPGCKSAGRNRYRKYQQMNEKLNNHVVSVN